MSLPDGAPPDEYDRLLAQAPAPADRSAALAAWEDYCRGVEAVVLAEEGVAGGAAVFGTCRRCGSARAGEGQRRGRSPPPGAVCW